ncbi:hypothetical protein LCGC14_0556600 [marine sediment metagenome]|uniref:Tyr recombinase domain-containing protein n=1 Tax=marine sediment metagenome TaxID=412755 RepID=A0A0F9S6U6_9ZZZZ
MTQEYIIRKGGRKWAVKDNVNRFLFPDEYKKFEDQLKSKQKFSVICLINTGARINEMQNVRVEDCDLDRNRVILRVTKAKAKKGEKKGKPRIIPVSSKFSKYLRKFIRQNDLTQKDYLPILKNNSLNEAYKKAGKKAGIKDYYNISSHTFRKTLEVWLMSLGVESLPLVAHLGHDLKTAVEHYISPDIFNWEDRQKMRDIIGDLYRR